MEKQIIASIPTKNDFNRILDLNTGLVIIKLGAEWCGPCKLIKDVVHAFFASAPPEVICADIDVDECFELYSLLKSRRVVNGIPVLLCYKKGNRTPIPDDSVVGADPAALDAFFKRCGMYIYQMKKNRVI
jgi:thiol-disulfide isomerase/thioredoxin